jgi:hypothetical protein
MVKAVIGSEDAKQLKAILLSSNTVSRKTDKMADDFTAIQLDESINNSNTAQFSYLVRCISYAFIKENMIFFKTLPDDTTGKCLFDLFLET